MVISGETGTGKTLLLGALRLLRGESARKDQIGPTGDETVVQARFVDEDGERVLGRSVDRRRSSATIDGSLATAASLAEVLSGVLDVVGQHDRTMLSEPRAVRRVLDDAMGPRAAKPSIAMQMPGAPMSRSTNEPRRSAATDEHSSENSTWSDSSGTRS